MSHRSPATSTLVGGVKLAGILGGTAVEPALNYGAFSPDQAVGFNNKEITGVATPTAADSAATRGWVLAQFGNLDFKGDIHGVRDTDFACTRDGNVLTATANGALASGDFDDITLTHNSTAGAEDGTQAGSVALLLINQGDAEENGVYFIKDIGDASNPAVLERVDWFDEDAEVAGAVLRVLSGGTTYQNQAYWLTSPLDPTVNTDNLVFTAVGTVSINAVDGTITTIEPDADADAGASPLAAAADHTHAIVCEAPAATGSLAESAAEGNSTSLARANHVHSTIPASDGVNFGSSTNRWDMFARQVSVNVTEVNASPYTMVDGDYLIRGNTDIIGGGLTVNLQDLGVGDVGRKVIIKNTGSAGQVTIDPDGASLIDGAATYVTSAQYESVTCIWHGSGWDIV